METGKNYFNEFTSFTNIIFLCTVSFPDHHSVPIGKKETTTQPIKTVSEPIFRKERLALVMIGFTSTGLFTGSQIWLPTYGEDA